MLEERQQPYFVNPGVSAEQLEDWLNQQLLHVACFNRLVKEKATLEGQLEEINKSIEALSASGFKGKRCFPLGSQSSGWKSSIGQYFLSNNPL